MFEIVPNRHPIWAHFAFALLVIAAAADKAESQEHGHAVSRNPVSAQSAATGPEHPAAQSATALQQAIAGGDEARIRSLMAEDVLIFESGNVESSLSEYASHHMSSDMAFMAAVKSEPISRKVIEAGNTAIVLTRYRVQGTFQQQDVNVTTAETLVMRKLEGQWKIVHVHWSSR